MNRTIAGIEGRKYVSERKKEAIVARKARMRSESGNESWSARCRRKESQKHTSIIGDEKRRRLSENRKEAEKEERRIDGYEGF